MPRLLMSLATFLLTLLLGAGSSLVADLLTSSQPERHVDSVEGSESTQLPRNIAGTKPDEDLLRHTVDSLHEIQEDFVDVPANARPLLTYFKHQIRDVIAQTCVREGDQLRRRSPQGLGSIERSWCDR